MPDLHPSAFDILREKSHEFFEEILVKLKVNSGITFRTCAEISASVTGELLGHVYGRINPLHLGEMSRNLQIASEYGKQLQIRA